MAEFEAFCQSTGIRLFVLPPRSPKLNGCVERSQRTHATEFYDLTDAEQTLPGYAAALARHEQTYNTIRPHQSLAYKTPHQYLQEVSPSCA